MAQLKEIPNSYFFSVQQVSIRGTCDILGLINGKFVGLELKRDDKAKPTPIQEYVIKKIQEAGGWAAVVRPSTWDKQLEQLKELL